MNFRRFVPMFFTLLRIVLSPIIVFLLFTNNKAFLFLAIFIFTLASFTDFFDGYFARKYNGKSKLGEFLDPLADKILVLSVFLTFYFKNIVPLWVLIVIFSRDFFIMFFRLFLAKNRKSLKTSFFAKYKTFFQFVVIYLIFVFLITEQSYLKTLVDYFLYFTVLITVLTGLDYFFKDSKIYRKLREYI